MNILNHLRRVMTRKPALFRKFLVVGALTATVPLFFTSRAVFIGLAQIKDEKQKKITRVRYPNEPLQIIGIGNGQRTFGINEKFEQEHDWLKDFSIRIKNDSGKTLTYLAWELDFPETQSTGPLMVYTMYYGVHPIRKHNEYENEPPIEAGGILEQRIDQKKFDNMKTFIGKRHQVDRLTTANIRILEIRYDDGTGWNSGSITKEDPVNPGHFVPITSGKNGGD